MPARVLWRSHYKTDEFLAAAAASAEYRRLFCCFRVNTGGRGIARPPWSPPPRFPRKKRPLPNQRHEHAADTRRPPYLFIFRRRFNLHLCFASRVGGINTQSPSDAGVLGPDREFIICNILIISVCHAHARNVLWYGIALKVSQHVPPVDDISHFIIALHIAHIYQFTLKRKGPYDHHYLFLFFTVGLVFMACLWNTTPSHFLDKKNAARERILPQFLREY